MSIRDTGKKYEKKDRDRFVICAEGLPKKGKTHLGFTAPEPIFLFNLDKGDEGVIDKFADKEIYYEDYIIPSNATDEKKEDTLDRFLKDYFSTIHNEKEGTVMVDSFTQVWDLIYTVELERVKESRSNSKVYPFDYADANSVAEHVVKEIYDTPLNLYITQRLQSEYNEKGNKVPNKYKAKGYKGMPYLVQIYGRIVVDDNQRHFEIMHNRFKDTKDGEDHKVYEPSFEKISSTAKRV